MNQKLDSLFPRDFYGRIALALASLSLGPACWLITVWLFAAKPGGVLHCFILVVVKEFFLALALFFTCGLIWSLAMPAWLERLLEKVANRLTIALAIFAASLSILAGWALAFG